MASKTPVSILNEYMFRKKVTPHFELVHGSVGHDTLFEYVVTVNGARAKGSGRSKKEAKHNAAQKALEELAKCDEEVRQQLLFTSGVPLERCVDTDQDSSIASVAVSPYAEQVTENTVGALATLCAQHMLPLPEYTLMDESGPAHCKTFTMHCSVPSLVEAGVARTKKQAKHIAAKNMLDKIKELVSKQSTQKPEETNCLRMGTSNSSDRREVIQIYSSIKEKERVNTRESLSLNIASCHMNLEKLAGSEVTALKSKQITDGPEERLKRFAEEQCVALSYSKLNSTQGGQHICIAALTTSPEMVRFGYGSKEDEAREAASSSLLLALSTMIIRDEDDA